MASCLPVLIIDDEPDICDLVAMTLDRMGVENVAANDLSTARRLLDEKTFSLCLTDMRLPDGTGLEVIEYIQSHCPGTPVAMITAHGNMDTAIAALKTGAFDFLSKPLDLNQLRKLVESAISLAATPSSATDLNTIAEKLVGNSPALTELKGKIVRIARSQAPVFISGESGTGKEVIARLIHQSSARRDQPFVAVNCGAIPAELMESEFFGHLKGSFTGATNDKTGLFQAAQGGTLLLDEVADLPMNMQVKLLRAIQEKAIRPVGDSQEHPVDVRILSATHKNLPELIHQEKFRSDLFYRINVIEMAIPSLRERSADIPDLTAHILDHLPSDNGPLSIDDDAMDALLAYSFPGNVRELENILERTVALCDSNRITARDLELSLNRGTAQQPQRLAISENQPENSALKSPTSARAHLPLDSYLENIEISEIQSALEISRWNKTEAAKLLGISFRSLRYRMKKLGLDD